MNYCVITYILDAQELRVAFGIFRIDLAKFAFAAFLEEIPLECIVVPGGIAQLKY